MWDFSIILLFPTSFIFGMSFYPETEEYNFNEFNLYLGIVQFQLRWQRKRNLGTQG